MRTEFAALGITAGLLTAPAEPRHLGQGEWLNVTWLLEHDYLTAAGA
ncbi:hypothetical protein ABZ438_09535 [Streptomyces sp. NPDC005786]